MTTVEEALITTVNSGTLSHGDAQFAVPLAELVEQGVDLRADQRRAIWRMLQRLGVDTDDPGGAKGSPVPLRSRNAVALDYVAESYGPALGPRLAITAPYRHLEMIKALPGRKWHGEPKYWSLPPTPDAVKVFSTAFPDAVMDDQSRELLDRVEAVAAKHQEIEQGDLPPIPIALTKPWPHQLKAYHHAVDQPGYLLGMEMGTGKAHPLDEPVLTPAGWRPIGDLAPGDNVIGQDGKPTKITGVYDRGVLDVVKVVTSDGGVVRCSPDHLWTWQTTGDGQHDQWRTTSTRDLRRFMTDYPKQSVYIPTVQPVEFDSEWPLPLDPWLLGFLLGDGHLHRSGITFTTADQPVVDKVIDIAADYGCTVKEYAQAGLAKTYGIVSPRGEDNVILQILNGLGLLGTHSRTKFVPVAYLMAAVDERLSLLRGLLDVDGHGDRGHVEFVSASPHLADAVVWLARSLGGVPSRGIKVIPEGTYHRLGVSMPSGIRPFSLDRKNAGGTRTRRVRRRITGFVDYGQAECRCISVAAGDGLYVTNDFLVTHNTKVAIDLMVNAGAQQALILCPKSVLGVWSREFRVHAGDRYHVEVLTDGKRTIPERAQRADWLLHECRCGKPHALVINYEAAYPKAFADWALSEQWDYVVCDESHRIKAPTGAQSKFCAKLRDRAKHRLALTGTPMAQSPMDIWAQYRFIDPDVFDGSFNSFKYRYAVMGGWQGKQVIGMDPRHQAELADLYYSRCYEVGSEVLDLPDATDVTRYCELEPAARKVYKGLAEDMYAEIGDDEVSTANVLVKLLRCMQVTGGSVGTDDGDIREISLAKEKLLAEVLEEAGPQHRPCAVFCRFIADLDRVHRVCEAAGYRSAELSGRRNDMTADAHMPDDADVIAVQIQAGGVGIDLTRASVAVYYSTGHSLSNYKQSRARLLRPGQEHPVLFVHLACENTVDTDVMSALIENQEVIDRVRGHKK